MHIGRIHTLDRKNIMKFKKYVREYKKGNNLGKKDNDLDNLKPPSYIE